jgi:uncharacterized protein (DUF1501 family)
MAHPAWWHRLGLAVSVVVVLSATTSCAPGTPDGDSWRIDAQRSVSNAAAAVHTAELALRLNDDGRVFDHYLQTVLVNSEDQVGMASDALGSKQPPEAERERYDTVTGQLDEAASLVSTTRIAVVDRESSRYDALADRLAKAGAALLRLEDQLQHPPTAAAAG